MRDITSIFNNTPLKNKTYKIYGTAPTDKDIPKDVDHVFYSPYFIMSFAFDSRCDTRYNLHCCTHDIAHVIDLWKRGATDRLFLNNFGWRIRDDYEKWPRNDLFKELRVITLQGFLTQNLFGWDRRLAYQTFARRLLRNRAKPSDPAFFPTNNEWVTKVNEYERENDRIGFNNYIDMWQDACKYVKLKR